MKNMDELTTRLNDARDRMTNYIKSVEEELKKIGVFAEVPTATNPDNEGDMNYVCFGRSNPHGWCIYITFNNDDEKPLLSCSIALKLAAFEYIPKLIAEVALNARYTLEKIESALNTVTTKESE